MQARYPDLPLRRAFFVAQPRTIGGAEDLLVYTFWGEHIQQDLRHELTHALLHSVIRDVPLWLDEGLAEYFELPPDRMGVNPAHLENLRSGPLGPYKPDLARLEGLTEVEQMTPAEYRESWAWVHLMLRDKPEAKSVLTNYLHQLRRQQRPWHCWSRSWPRFSHRRTMRSTDTWPSWKRRPAAMRWSIELRRIAKRPVTLWRAGRVSDRSEPKTPVAYAAGSPSRPITSPPEIAPVPPSSCECCRACRRR